MSKVIEIVNTTDPSHLGTIVEDRHGQVFYVSSCWTYDCGYETMAFLCNDKHAVLSWNHVLSRHYPDSIAMIEGHEETTNNIEEYLGEGVDYLD